MSVRRREVVSSTTCRPSGVRDTCTTRRSACAWCRRMRPLPASRSHIRPAVDGAMSRALARSPSRCGPLEASTTRARYWAMVISSAAAPRDFVATVIRARLALSTASTTPGAGASGLTAASSATLAHPGFRCPLWHAQTIALYNTILMQVLGGRSARLSQDGTDHAMRTACATNRNPACIRACAGLPPLDSGDLVGQVSGQGFPAWSAPRRGEHRRAAAVI